MPSSSSLWAIRTLSSADRLTASPWVPSRNVVSKVKMRMEPSGYAGLFLLLEERHHGPQTGAHGFDELVLLRLAHGQEVLAAALVLCHPVLGEFAGLDLGQNLPHLGARLLIDDARSARVVAIFGGVGNRIAHVAEAALVNKIDNQLHFV